MAPRLLISRMLRILHPHGFGKIKKPSSKLLKGTYGGQKYILPDAVCLSLCRSKQVKQYVVFIGT